MDEPLPASILENRVVQAVPVGEDGRKVSAGLSERVYSGTWRGEAGERRHEVTLRSFLRKVPVLAVLGLVFSEPKSEIQQRPQTEPAPLTFNEAWLGPSRWSPNWSACSVLGD